MNRIKELRIIKGVSQAQLGDFLGCASTTISKYELERRDLDPKTINHLCDFFGVTSDYLLCRSSSPTASMTDEEAALLRAYRAADDRARAVVNLTLEPFKEQPAGNATTGRRKNSAAG